MDCVHQVVFTLDKVHTNDFVQGSVIRARLSKYNPINGTVTAMIKKWFSQDLVPT